MTWMMVSGLSFFRKHLKTFRFCQTAAAEVVLQQLEPDTQQQPAGELKISCSMKRCSIKHRESKANTFSRFLLPQETQLLFSCWGSCWGGSCWGGSCCVKDHKSERFTALRVGEQVTVRIWEQALNWSCWKSATQSLKSKLVHSKNTTRTQFFHPNTLHPSNLK